MERLTDLDNDVEIIVNTDRACWYLSNSRKVVTKGISEAPDSYAIKQLTPEKEEWNIYQEIASLLLSAPITIDG